MPRKKKTYSFRGLAHALNYHPEVGKFARERAGAFRGIEDFSVLVKAATQRHFFVSSDEKTLVAFGSIYSRQPDDVISFLALIRKILHKWDKTQSGTVMKYLCSRRIIQVESRRPEYDANGECTAVIVKNLITQDEKRIPVSGPDREAITKLLIPQWAQIHSLVDKELAGLLKVNPESVKKARHEMSRISKEIEFWEHPEVVEYMKKGVMTPECERLWKQYGKKGKVV